MKVTFRGQTYKESDFAFPDHQTPIKLDPAEVLIVTMKNGDQYIYHESIWYKVKSANEALQALQEAPPRD